MVAAYEPCSYQDIDHQEKPKMVEKKHGNNQVKPKSYQGKLESNMVSLKDFKDSMEATKGI